MPTISGGFETGMEGWGGYPGAPGNPGTRSDYGGYQRSGSWYVSIAAADYPGSTYICYPLPDASSATITASIWVRGYVQSYHQGNVALQIRSGTTVLAQQVKMTKINTYEQWSVSFTTTGQPDINIFLDGSGPESCFVDDYIITYDPTTSTYTKDGGLWKPANKFVKHGGLWKPATTFVRSGGIWKQV